MRKAMSASAACLAALAMASTASTANAAGDDPPPPDKITVEVLTVNGSGCPAGTAAVATASDNSGFTVTYSNYLAQAGGSSTATDFRKNCQLNLRVHVPQGFTYAIAGADYRGFANLEAGASAVERASYYHQGTSPTQAVTHNLKGSLVDNWEFSDRTPVTELVYKPCGEERNFNVNTELRVTKGSDPSKTSFIAFDSTDGSVNTLYHFSWKRCPGA
ncbi:DUF4360 domain-containing protein [Actinomadura roseirufa]|uniref:DUF4360 domain-containing protein n=1 Tax=Actinomadura roseirufa TaxID=2094049 RepID=UPI001041566F|nr:DUF4360 domain-containing protein [Actinomadura roseirufa]